MLNFGRSIEPTDLANASFRCPTDLIRCMTLEIICSSSPGSQGVFGGAEGVRTPDLRLAKPALCQLSYAPKASGKVGCGGGI